MSVRFPGAKARLPVPVATALLVIALAAAVWALALRERSTRRLTVEYEAYKALTALTDLARTDPASGRDAEGVLGFGLYAFDGTSIISYGVAPASLRPLIVSGEASSRTIGRESVVIVRPLGGDMPGRRMMNGGERQWRLRGGQAPSEQGGQPPAPSGRIEPPAPGGAGGTGAPPEAAEPMMTPMGGMRMPAYAYLEYSLGGLKAAEATILALAVFSTVALAILYGVVVSTYGRYQAARDRESRDRELVELGQAARTIAHEIKNPLGVIRLQCGLLKKGADPKTASGLAIIDEEAVRLASMAERLRSYLRSGEGEPSLVDVRAFLATFAARYANALDSSIGAFEEGAAVWVDDRRLTEALDNVVANALEAGGPERPLLEAKAASRRLLVSIADRGPGVPPELRRRLFEPFFTTKTKGTGLGLALARKHVEAAGGAIAYAERPGGGSVLTIGLPLADDRDAASRADRPGSEPPGR